MIVFILVLLGSVSLSQADPFEPVDLVGDLNHLHQCVLNDDPFYVVRPKFLALLQFFLPYADLGLLRSNTNDTLPPFTRVTFFTQIEDELLMHPHEGARQLATLLLSAVPMVFIPDQIAALFENLLLATVDAARGDMTFFMPLYLRILKRIPQSVCFTPESRLLERFFRSFLLTFLNHTPETIDATLVAVWNQIYERSPPSETAPLMKFMLRRLTQREAPIMSLLFHSGFRTLALAQNSAYPFYGFYQLLQGIPTLRPLFPLLGIGFLARERRLDQLIELVFWLNREKDRLHVVDLDQRAIHRLILELLEIHRGTVPKALDRFPLPHLSLDVCAFPMQPLHPSFVHDLDRSQLLTPDEVRAWFMGVYNRSLIQQSEQPFVSGCHQRPDP